MQKIVIIKLDFNKRKKNEKTKIFANGIYLLNYNDI